VSHGVLHACFPAATDAFSTSNYVIYLIVVNLYLARVNGINVLFVQANETRVGVERPSNTERRGAASYFIDYDTTAVHYC
jgi:hypothetical protein